ncbi:hypothetical protein [Corynebacterium heidelbergense]|uniref:Uncharacterized protein n=1 Tax=Corynebacterium heidelbergense TaxID=2055947 RepID=A0A364VCI1_9CORY|nr:hypothetical protein [Corynebacterium heidelbergense]RAV34347.1 hypothetical protein CWC39_03650 [Corynebacterium heidelbergense]WCZ36463.1 hypothetical protein CHEID_04580 [Corynebacterium heidelbergense]
MTTPHDETRRPPTPGDMAAQDPAHHTAHPTPSADPADVGARVAELLSQDAEGFQEAELLERAQRIVADALERG